MFAGKALRCDCGYEVREADEASLVDSVRRHAREAHEIEFTVELALDVIRRAGVVPNGEHMGNREEE